MDTIVNIGSNTKGQPVPTGSFDAGDKVSIRFSVPEEAARVFILMAQVLSDADLTLTFNGKTKRGLQSVSFDVRNPPSGDYVATLTADGRVTDVNAHVTIRLKR